MHIVVKFPTTDLLAEPSGNESLILSEFPHYVMYSLDLTLNCFLTSVLYIFEIKSFSFKKER